MKRIYLFLIGLLVWSEISAQQLVKVGDGYSSTSVNTTVFRNSSLVTDGDVQYISYYDADGYLTVGKRALGSTEWTLHRSQYKGNVADAHNVISMMVDGDGYLHRPSRKQIKLLQEYGTRCFDAGRKRSNDR